MAALIAGADTNSGTRGSVPAHRIQHIRGAFRCNFSDKYERGEQVGRGTFGEVRRGSVCVSWPTLQIRMHTQY